MPVLIHLHVVSKEVTHRNTKQDPLAWKKNLPFLYFPADLVHFIMFKLIQIDSRRHRLSVGTVA